MDEYMRMGGGKVAVDRYFEILYLCPTLSLLNLFMHIDFSSSHTGAFTVTYKEPELLKQVFKRKLILDNDSLKML